MYETLSTEQDGRGVVTLRLERADKHNAMSAQMIGELTEAAQALGQDADVRAVILTGAGESFCAGGDLGWMRAQMQADDAGRAREARALAMMLKALNELPKPLIGRINGQAFGGGIGLMSVCDVAVGVEGARFGLTETRLGLIPATIGPYVVARMGAAMARRVFLSARIFDAHEAERLGLLAQVVTPGDLDGAVEAQVAPFLACAPGAVAEAKALLGQLGAPVSQGAIEASIGALVARWQSPEAEEGIAAFFEKRPPDWRT